jgi:hypothetical protein
MPATYQIQRSEILSVFPAYQSKFAEEALMRMTGGILSITSGIAVSVIGILFIALADIFDKNSVGLSSTSVTFWGVVWILLGLAAIAGGAFAFTKKNWMMSVAGVVCVLIALILAYSVVWRSVFASWWILLMAILALGFYFADRKSFVSQK